MKINVKDNHQNFDSVGVGNYTLEVDDNKVINSMTTKSPIYYYALVNYPHLKEGACNRD